MMSGFDVAFYENIQTILHAMSDINHDFQFIFVFS